MNDDGRGTSKIDLIGRLLADALVSRGDCPDRSSALIAVALALVPGAQS